MHGQNHIKMCYVPRAVITCMVSSSWWWTQQCPKHVEHIISSINHCVASSWIFSVHIPYFVRSCCSLHRLRSALWLLTERSLPQFLFVADILLGHVPRPRSVSGISGARAHTHTHTHTHTHIDQLFPNIPNSVPRTQQKTRKDYRNLILFIFHAVI